MKSAALIAIAAATKLASAHATIQAVWINGDDQGLGNSQSGYIRSPPSTDPVMDYGSEAMTCNVNNQPTDQTLKVVAGDKVEFEWRHMGRTPEDQIIDPSHQGPVMTYIAPTEKGNNGQGWVKLSEDGYENGEWAVDRLRANGGRHGITVPDLTPGQYLLRGEIIALHEGHLDNGAQFYMECVQIEITSSGTKELPEGVAIPGAYSAEDPGIAFNLWQPYDSYPIPGPELWEGAEKEIGYGSKADSEPVASDTGNDARAVPTTLRTLVGTAGVAGPTATVPVSTSPDYTPAPGENDDDGLLGLWDNCGGIGWIKQCRAGLTCKHIDQSWAQCVLG